MRDSQKLGRLKALRVAFGCAVRVLRNVFTHVRSVQVAPGDTVIVNYELRIK